MANRPVARSPKGRYPLLAQIPPGPQQDLHKLVLDRLSALEDAHAALAATVAAAPTGLTAAEVQALITLAAIPKTP